MKDNERINEFSEYLKQRLDCGISYENQNGKEGWRISTEVGSIFISFKAMCSYQFDYIYEYFVKPELV